MTRQTHEIARSSGCRSKSGVLGSICWVVCSLAVAGCTSVLGDLTVGDQTSDSGGSAGEGGEAPSSGGRGGAVGGSAGAVAGNGGASGGGGGSPVDTGGQSSSQGGQPSSQGGTSGGNGGAGGPAALELVSTAPANGSSDVDPSTDLVLTFDDDVELGSGSVRLMRASDDRLIEEVPVGDLRLTAVNEAISIDFDSILAGDTAYFVTLSATAVVGPGGAVFSGIDNDDGVAFRTAPVPAPGTVQSGLKLWLDASVATAFKIDVGVRVWSDRSGEGSNLTQVDITRQPILNSTALNGSSAVRFAAAEQFLVGAGVLDFDSFDGFLVWQTGVSADSASEARVLDNGEQFRITHGASAPTNRHALQSQIAGVARSVQFAPTQANRAELWNFTFNQEQPTLSTRSEGGGAVSLESLGGPVDAPTTAFALGADASGNFALTGDIAELIVYDRVLSDAERSSVVAYLQAKWQLQLRQCASGEVLGPNGDCYYYGTTARSWTSARNSCQSRGGGWDLASVRSALDNAFVTTLLPNEAWLGGIDAQGAPETFFWADGGSVFWNGDATGSPPSGAYANFSSVEPNGGGDDDDCVRILTNGLWADLDCPTSLVYLCQGPAN